MKPKSTLRAFLCIASSLLLSISCVHAADGTWLGNSGAWSDITANPTSVWSGGTPADLIDSTAFFTGVDIAADQIINLDDAPRTIGNITFTDATTASNNLTISGANILTLDRTTGAPLIDVTQTGRTLTISSQISGADGLQKNGTGTLSLSGNNDYTGTTVISNGILAISSNTALGATSENTTIAATGSDNGPRLTLSGGISSAENISITGNTDQNQYNGAISNTSGTNTISGTITLANPAGNIRITSAGGELIFGGTITQTTSAKTLILQANTGAALTVNNAIANNNGALHILGSYGGGPSNGVTLKAASTAIGATTVMENGLLKLGITDAIKTTSTLTLGAAYNFVGNGGFDYGKFDLAGYNQTVSALIGTKNTGNTIGADSNRIVTNSAASGTSVLTVGNSNGSGTFNGVILDDPTAAVALTKIGTGTQTLVGNSNYSGVTTISAGTIAISHANALGSTTGNTTIAATGATSGARLQLSGGITSAENITITGRTETSGGYNPVIFSSSGSNTLSGTITLSSLTGGLRLGAGTTIFSGNITQTGSSQALVFQGTNTVSNAIANNGGALVIYQGTTTLNGASGSGIGATSIDQSGTLKLGITNAINTAANLSVGISGTTTDGFDLASFDQTVNGLSSVTGGTRRVFNSVASSTSTLTVGNGGGTATFNGTIVDNTGTGGTVALIKTGSGTQTLAGVNTYSGDTTISDGTLTLNNANANNQTSTVTIAASGAKLQLTFPSISPDTVDKFFIGTTQQVIGEYGHTNSGATNGGAGVGAMDAYFAAGTGKLNVTTGPSGGNTDPTISDIVNQSVPSGGNTGALPITVGDLETPVGSLTLSISANDNTTLVPNGNIIFGGSGANRTVTVTPVSGLSGSATITIRVTDGGSLFDEDTFTLTVTDNYLSWATTNNVTGGEGGDHDNDGVKNLVEYALVDGGERGVLNGLTITYTKRGGVYGSDLTYIIETSETLASGSWSDAVTHGPGLLLSNPTISYTFTPSTPVKEFARLKITSP